MEEAIYYNYKLLYLAEKAKRIQLGETNKQKLALIESMEQDYKKLRKDRWRINMELTNTSESLKEAEKIIDQLQEQLETYKISLRYVKTLHPELFPFANDKIGR